jgi:NADPH2:quinone reductase
MEALGAVKHGDYKELEFLTLPRPKVTADTDVLIEIAYTDTNPVDLQKLLGNKGSGQPITNNTNEPFVPGFGGSGTVLETGKDAPVEWIGQRVCFIADPTRRGSYATHIVVDYRCVALVPSSGVSLRDAASIPVAGLTAFESLHKVGLAAVTNVDREISSNVVEKSLLIIGGAGGVGSWTISLARAWHPKLKIIATASMDMQHDWCRSLGADEVIKHDEIKRLPGGGQNGCVDAIICLTEPTPDLIGACAEVIRPYGSMCLVVSGKSIQSLDMSFFFFKSATMSTQTVFSSIRTKFQHIIPAKELSVILELLCSERLKAPISPDLESGEVKETFKDALSETGVLHSLTNTSGRRGKYVMKV